MRSSASGRVLPLRTLFDDSTSHDALRLEALKKRLRAHRYGDTDESTAPSEDAAAAPQRTRRSGGAAGIKVKGGDQLRLIPTARRRGLLW